MSWKGGVARRNASFHLQVKLFCVYVYVYVYLFVYEGYCIWQLMKAGVDLRPVNNTQWAETRPQHRELRALLFSISVWVL